MIYWFDDAESTEGINPASFSPKQRAKMAHANLSKEDITVEHRKMMQKQLEDAKKDYDASTSTEPTLPTPKQKKKSWQFWK